MRLRHASAPSLGQPLTQLGRGESATRRSINAMHSALLLLSLVLLAPRASASDPDEWPQWRGAQGDGLSHGTPWSSSGVARWSVEIGLGYSAPAVAQGRVVTYGFDRERALDVLRCLDADTGEERWRAELPGEERANQHEGGTLSSPCLAGERVFVFSSSAVLSCHRLADGELLWRADLAERHGLDPGYYGFAGSPIVADGQLLVAAGRVLALEPASGATRWTSEPWNALYSTPVPFAIGGQRRLGVFSQDALHLLDPDTGAALAAFPWHDSDRLVNAATPIVVGESLFVSSAYDHGCALVEFGPDGPRARFKNRAMRNKMAGGILLAGHLYGFDESVLKCLDLEGNERWRVRGLGNGALSGGDGKLAILSSSGELVVARATGEAFEELARVPLFEEGVCWTPPVIAGGRIYCRNNRGRLIARDHISPDSISRDHGGTPTPGPALPVAAADRSLPDAEALLAKHLAAIGGAEAVAAHPARRLTGTYEQRSVGFVPAPFEILAVAPDRRRVWIQLPPPLDERFAENGEPGHIARVHDGAESFEHNAYRGDKLITDDEAREEAVAARLPFATEAGALYRALRTEARVVFDERDCFRVHATTHDGRTRFLYFECESGRLAGREAEDEALVRYRDYRAFDGLRLPTSVRAFRPEGGLEEHFRVTAVDFGPVDEARFARGPRVIELLVERDGREPANR